MIELSTVYYPYSQEMENNLKDEARTNGLIPDVQISENRFLSGSEKSGLIQVLNSMQYGLSYNLSSMHIFIKESYEYDRNGNRKAKVTPYGKIEYVYDKENCLLSSGSNGQAFVNYTYDNMGNLLTEVSEEKTVKYAYNVQNRMIYCEVMDRSKKEYAETTYVYDAFGRRILVQDKGESALRTLYDGLTFDVIKQSPVFENGMFTDSNNTGIQWGAGKPTGDRYRYISDEDSKDKNRYFYLDENTYKTVNSRYRGERAQYTVNGSLAAQTSKDYGAEYFSTDLLGSVSSVTDSYGTQKVNYTYDAFGSLVQGELSDTTDFGYLSKQSDITAKLYDYGYRDYKPQVARFTTIDPIRDGENWFLYCNCDPVNYTDPTGLSTSVDEKTGTILSATNDNDCGVYAYPTVDGQRVEGPGLLTGLTGTPGYFVSTPANPGNIQISGQETNYIGQNINNYGSGFAFGDFNYYNLDSTIQNTVSANVKKEDHHLRNGLLEIGAGLAICVLTGIEVRNIMLKKPESTSKVGYGGIIAGGTLIADGIARAVGNSKTTVKEDFISLLESPLGSAVREFNNSNGKGRAPGRTYDFSKNNSIKKKDKNK